MSVRRLLVRKVDRSTTATDWVDAVETRWTQAHIAGPEPTQGEKHHLAKVRVADSNPVFRSNETPQGAFLALWHKSDSHQGRPTEFMMGFRLCGSPRW
jgi:hypothetical protein